MLVNDALDLLAPSSNGGESVARFLPETPLILFNGHQDWEKLGDLPAWEAAVLFHEIVHSWEILKFIPFNLYYWCCLLDFLLEMQLQDMEGRFVRTYTSNWPPKEMMCWVKSRFNMEAVQVGYDIFLEANPTLELIAQLIEFGEEEQAWALVENWAKTLTQENFLHALAFFLLRELKFRCEADPWLRGITNPVENVLNADYFLSQERNEHFRRFIERKLFDQHPFRSYLLFNLQAVRSKGGIFIASRQSLPLLIPHWWKGLKLRFAGSQKVFELLFDNSSLAFFNNLRNHKWSLEEFVKKLFSLARTTLFRGIVALFLVLEDWLDIETQELPLWGELVSEILPRVTVMLGLELNRDCPVFPPLIPVIERLTQRSLERRSLEASHPPILLPGGRLQVREGDEDLADGWLYFGVVQSLRHWFAGDPLVCPFWYREGFCDEGVIGVEMCVYNHDDLNLKEIKERNCPFWKMISHLISWRWSLK